MAQESNSGFGSLLMKGITAILSITLTATVTTIVQRYITPSAAEPTSAATQSAVTQSAITQPATSPMIVPDTIPVNPVSQTPAPEGQAIDPVIGQTEPQSNLQAPQPDLQTSTDPNVPVNVPVNSSANSQVEPQVDSQAASQTQPQTDAPASSLREQLNRSIQDKWNRN
jgi:hypothetical protein